MPEGLDFALGSMGGLLVLFGAFLLLYEKFEHCVGGCRLEPRTQIAARMLVVVGACLVAAGFILLVGL